MNARDIARQVQTALELQANVDAGLAPGERRPLADKLAEIIPALIVDLRRSYLEMLAISAEWQQKAFQAKLAEAYSTNSLLAGFPASVWMGWGGLLLALMAFLDTEQTELGGATAKDFLLDDYLPLTQEEWTALNPPEQPEPEPVPE